MEDNYSIFRKFPSLEQASELKALLNENGIETILDDNAPSVDVTFTGNTLQNEIEVRIKQTDFQKAESILEKEVENLIETIDKDYYLFKFTDEELYDILLKSDEWNAFDYTLAQKILIQRGKPIDKELLNSLKNERLKQLAEPEGNQKPWIIAGYFFAVLGGFLGLIIGYFLWTSKKTLPDGQKIHTYAENDRKHGKYIFYISLVIAPTTILFRVVSQILN
ncbi:hypothetical protein DFQ09_10424 [Winogradskyella pacifica]|jgi:hypothetical protein|uniref:Signal transducing protein n=1 Tax=Winogradskyella pacifica TaxID=664642 RepID=A0A3D9MYD2_9FLAO|nr:hypothetical protein [Winogradskyella pacifica]REE24259.1 hypothetical protein DFQ09_10424 [Winogradskyella pacifica]